jgi:cysteine synthase
MLIRNESESAKRVRLEGERGVMEYFLRYNLPRLAKLPDFFRLFIEELKIATSVSIYVFPLFSISSGNGKTPPAFQLLESKAESGILEGLEIWMASSGNAAANVARMAPWYGARVVAPVEEALPPGKLGLLRLAGATIRHPPKGVSTIDFAQDEGSKPGRLVINQYTDPASVEAHTRFTWPHVGREMVRINKAPSAVCVALGTTSSFVSAAYLKSLWPNLQLLGVACDPNEEKVPGARTEEGLEVTGFSYRAFLDHPQEKKDKLLLCGKCDAYAMCRELYPQGMSAGPTTGMAIHAFIELLNQLVREQDFGAIDRLRNAQGEIVLVVLGMDALAAYSSEF